MSEHKKELINHYTWQLTYLNGHEMKNYDFTDRKLENIPHLKMNTDKTFVLGSTGCNRLSGAFNFSESEERFHLVFTPLAVTKKFCPDTPYEQDFLKLLHETEYVTIDLNDLTMSFKNKNGEVTMTFSILEEVS